MKIINKLNDKRIQALNVLFEMSIKEYSEIAHSITKDNEYQRKRVKGSSTVYKLLREDLRLGCLIPPIVLAIRIEKMQKVLNPDSMKDEAILALIKPENLIILDGLQRTFTLFDLINELKNNKEDLNKLYDHPLRIEVYMGLNKIAILYRMLTLNTGQTPMSIRHQIEILYSDYLSAQIEGISLYREVDNKKITKIGDYSFKDVTEGFNSYLDRDELGINRSELLENIQNLETLANENESSDLFRQYIITYNNLIKKLDALFEKWDFTTESDYDKNKYVFGNNIFEIFTKSQALTGFGAAIGKLKFNLIITDFDAINKAIEKITVGGDNKKIIWDLLNCLDEIKLKAKNIGYYQRIYFGYLFKELFNKNETESYLNIGGAIQNAYKLYKIKV
ncbi:MAG TPA: hypothetical protein VIL99_05970 [Ignavibacteria bacterium]